MGQDKQIKLIELERKFQELGEKGHPNVVDNGFFLDAVFNVTAVLKSMSDNPCIDSVDYSTNVQVLEDLYKSLKAFEDLYTHRLRISHV